MFAFLTASTAHITWLRVALWQESLSTAGLPSSYFNCSEAYLKMIQGSNNTISTSFVSEAIQQWDSSMK